MFAVFLIIATLTLSALPGYNGDLPYYVASVIEKETGEKDPFAATIAALKQELPASEFLEHSARLGQTEPGILDFYRIKPIYIQLVYWLHQLGFSYILATLLPSLFAYFSIGILTFAWASKILEAKPALVLSVLLMLTNAAIVLSRLSTPDGISNLIFLICLFNIYFGKNKYLTCALLLLNIGIRMDNMVSVLVMLTGMKYWSASGKNKLTYVEYFCLSALAIGISLLMNRYLVSDAYWLRKATYFGSIQQYALQAMLYFRIFSDTYFMALLVFMAIIHFYWPFSLKERTGKMILLIAGIVFARFLLFPSIEARFMTAYYFAITLAIAEHVRQSFLKTSQA